MTTSSLSAGTAGGKVSFSLRIRERIRQTGLALLIAPAIIHLLVFLVVPLTRTLLRSVFDPMFTTQHYERFLETGLYRTVMERTFVRSLEVTVICLILGYIVAYVMNRSSPTVSGVLATLTVFPYFTNVLVRTFAWIVLLGKQGPLNQPLLRLGLIDDPLPLLFNTTSAMIGMVHIMLPTMVLLIYTVMRGIDVSLVQAAQGLGATPLRAFVTVFLPLSMPGVLVGCTLTFIGMLGMWFVPMFLGGRQDVLVASLIEMQVSQFLNEGFASALSAVLFVATLSMYALAMRYIGISRIWGVQLEGSQELSIQEDDSGSGEAAAVGGWRRQVRRAREVLQSRVLDPVSNSVWASLDLLGRLYPGGRRQPRVHLGRSIPSILAAFIMVFLLVPELVVMLLSFSGRRIVLWPPGDLGLRQYKFFFSSSTWMQSLKTGVLFATATMCFSTVVGTLAAVGLVRGRSRHKELLVAFILLPMIVPPMVEVAAYYFMSLQLGIIASPALIVLGQAKYSVPVVVLLVASNLQGVDPSLEEAAMSLGASRLRTFFSVTFPLIRAGMAVAGFLAFLYAFDDLLVMIFMGGGKYVSVTARMWAELKENLTPVLTVVAALEMMLSMLALVTTLIYQARRRRS